MNVERAANLIEFSTDHHLAAWDALLAGKGDDAAKDWDKAAKALSMAAMALGAQARQYMENARLAAEKHQETREAALQAA